MSKILLLEDDLSLINGLSFAFKKQGFELVVARTLKEADSLWTDGKYDLLVLDVSLPDGTGFDFCKKKRMRPSFKSSHHFFEAADEEMNIIMDWTLAEMIILQNRLLSVVSIQSKCSLLCWQKISAPQIHSWNQRNESAFLWGQVFKNEKLLDLTAVRI